jgi:hypothetical protein
MRNALITLLAVACLSATPLFAAPGLVETVKAYENLTAGPGHAVTNYSYTVGHATFSLPSGTVASVVAGEQQVGVYLIGPGKFTYDSANKDEFPVMRTNAKDGDVKLTTATDKVTYTDTFRSVLLLGSGFPAASGADASAAEQFTNHRALFARAYYFGAPVGHDFAYQAIDAPNAKLVYAEVDGGAYPVLYTFDDAYSHDETLVYLRKRMFRNGKFGDLLWGTLLSRQAIGRSNRAAAQARVRLTHVDVDLVGQMNEQGKLAVTETLVPVDRAANLMRFDLSNDLYFDIEYQPRRYNLRSVTDEKGNKLPFVHDGGDLLVSLAAPAPANLPVKLRFDIDGDFLYRPDKSNYWELGIDTWFPWVQRQGLAYTFHSLIKVEKPFVIFASGKTIRRAEEGNYNVLETKIEQPVDAVAILAGRYHSDEETRNGVTLRVASFIDSNAAANRTIRNFAFATIEGFQKFLGPFPFDEITIIEKDDLGYGQAPAGIVFITKEAFSPKDEEANDYVIGINRRIAHELAHQYWGSVVRIPSGDEQWIEEAFAEYSAAVFLKTTNLERQALRGFNEWKASAKEGVNAATIPTANRISNGANPGVASRQRFGLLYAKGALLLNALHNELGDQMFLTFLKSYQKSFKGKQGTTADVIGLLNFLTKKDYAPFFEQYFYATAMPEPKFK